MEWESVRKWVFDQEEKFHISRRQLLRALKIGCALAALLCKDQCRNDSLVNLLLMSVSESPPVVVIACSRPKAPKPAVIRKRIPQMPPSFYISN